jgi:hypothetical protein
MAEDKKQFKVLKQGNSYVVLTRVGRRTVRKPVDKAWISKNLDKIANRGQLADENPDFRKIYEEGIRGQHEGLKAEEDPKDEAPKAKDIDEPEVDNVDKEGPFVDAQKAQDELIKERNAKADAHEAEKNRPQTNQEIIEGAVRGRRTDLVIPRKGGSGSTMPNLPALKHNADLDYRAKRMREQALENESEFNRREEIVKGKYDENMGYGAYDALSDEEKAAARQSYGASGVRSVNNENKRRQDNIIAKQGLTFDDLETESDWRMREALPKGPADITKQGLAMQGISSDDKITQILNERAAKGEDVVQVGDPDKGIPGYVPPKDYKRPGSVEGEMASAYQAAANKPLEEFIFDPNQHKGLVDSYLQQGKSPEEIIREFEGRASRPPMPGDTEVTNQDLDAVKAMLGMPTSTDNVDLQNDAFSAARRAEEAGLLDVDDPGVQVPMRPEGQEYTPSTPKPKPKPKSEPTPAPTPAPAPSMDAPEVDDVTQRYIDGEDFSMEESRGPMDINQSPEQAQPDPLDAQMEHTPPDGVVRNDPKKRKEQYDLKRNPYSPQYDPSTSSPAEYISTKPKAPTPEGVPLNQNPYSPQYDPSTATPAPVAPIGEPIPFNTPDEPALPQIPTAPALPSAGSFPNNLPPVDGTAPVYPKGSLDVDTPYPPGQDIKSMQDETTRRTLPVVQEVQKGIVEADKRKDALPPQDPFTQDQPAPSIERPEVKPRPFQTMMENRSHSTPEGRERPITQTEMLFNSIRDHYARMGEDISGPNSPGMEKARRDFTLMQNQWKNMHPAEKDNFINSKILSHNEYRPNPLTGNQQDIDDYKNKRDMDNMDWRGRMESVGLGQEDVVRRRVNQDILDKTGGRGPSFHANPKYGNAKAAGDAYQDWRGGLTPYQTEQHDDFLFPEGRVSPAARMETKRREILGNDMSNPRPSFEAPQFGPGGSLADNAMYEFEKLPKNKQASRLKINHISNPFI